MKNNAKILKMKNEVKTRLFSQVSVLTDDDGVSDVTDFYSDIVMDGKVNNLPVLQRIRSDISNSREAIRFIENSKSLCPKEIVDDIVDGLKYDISNEERDDLDCELDILLYQLDRKYIIKIHDMITCKYKEIIDHERYMELCSKIQEDNILSCTPRYNRYPLEQLHLRLYINNNANLFSPMYKLTNGGDKQLLSQDTVDDIRHINDVAGFLKCGILMADSMTRAFYYETFKILGLLTLTEGVSNTDLIALMADLETTDIFNEYHDDIVSIAYYMIGRSDNLRDFRENLLTD